MMNRILGFGFLSVVLVMLVLATWLSIFMPARILHQMQNDFLARSGRALAANAGASLSLSPSLGVTFHDIRVDGASALSEPVLKAKSLFVPISLAQAFWSHPTKDEIVLEAPVFTMGFNSEGRANILLSDTTATVKADVKTALPAPLQVTFQNGSFVYKDELKTQSFTLSEAEGLITVDEQQEINLKSAAVLGGQRVHFQGALHSLPRAFSDGSPFDFNLDGAGAAFGFSGRVIATNGIDLAGQATVDTDDAARLLKWLGVELQGLGEKYPLAITSAVESQGAAFLLKKADVKIAKMTAQGDVSFSTAGERPHLTMAINMDELNNNLYASPVKGLATIGSWSDRLFDLNDMRTLNVEFRIAANRFHFGDFITGPTQVEGNLKDGVLSATLNNETSGKADVIFDSSQSPPKLSLNFDLKDLDAKTFVTQFTGMNWVQGALRLIATLNAEGASQAEMISNLKGNAEAQIDQGRIEGVDLAGLSAHIQSETVLGWEGAATRPVSGVVQLSVADGVATLQENNLTVPGIKISQTGEIDILRRALNLEAMLKLNRADGKPVKIKVTGPWIKPSFALLKSGN